MKVKKYIFCNSRPFFLLFKGLVPRVLLTNFRRNSYTEMVRPIRTSSPIGRFCTTGRCQELFHKLKLVLALKELWIVLVLFEWFSILKLLWPIHMQLGFLCTVLLHLPPLRFYLARIFKLLRGPEIDSASLCSLGCRYDNLISTRFLASIDCSKIPALLGVGWMLGLTTGPQLS